jgi:hypothetical protein
MRQNHVYTNEIPGSLCDSFSVRVCFAIFRVCVCVCVCVCVFVRARARACTRYIALTLLPKDFACAPANTCKTSCILHLAKQFSGLPATDYIR